MQGRSNQGGPFHGEGIMQRRLKKGNTPMAWTIDDFDKDGPGDIKIVEIRLHLSAASGVQNFTADIGSNDGAEYNCNLSTTAMNGLADKYLQPGNIIRAVDHLTLTFPNALALTWGVEVIYRPATDWD